MSFFKKQFFTIFIILVFILEGISKYYLYESSIKLDFTRYLKLLIFLLALLYLLYKKKYTFFYIPILLGVFFIFGHYLFGLKFLSFELIVVFAKYIFPLFILETSYLYFKENENSKLFKAFEFIVITNSILILIGLLLDLYLFKTYTGNRFGYNGLLITSATGSYFYVIALFYAYLKILKSKKYIVFSILTLLSSFIVGTKSIYLFIGFLILHFIIFNLKKISIYKRITGLIVILSILIFSFLRLVPSFLNIHKEFGIVSAILSYRDKLFIEKTLPFINENWSFINYLIGGQGTIYGRTQLGLLDLIFFFGIIGALLYLYIYYKVLFKTKRNIHSSFILFSLLVIIALSGNFFYSATITIYLVILQQALLKN